MIFRNPSGAPELACDQCGCRWFDRMSNTCYECGAEVPVASIVEFQQAARDFAAGVAAPIDAGPAAVPLEYPSVVHMLAAAARAEPRGEALVCGEERLSYSEYLRCVAGFSHELIGYGAMGGRVAIVLGNSIDICIALFAAHAARAQAAPLNPLYTSHELRDLLRDAEAQVLVYAAEAREAMETLAEELGIVHRVCIGSSAGARRLTAWRNATSLALPLPLPVAAELASLQYTGGTTGRAKGVELSHGAVAANLDQREALLPTRLQCERLLCVMPLFHIYAMAMCLHNTVRARGTLVIVPRYTPEATLAVFARERITIFAGSPTLFASLLNHPAFSTTNFSSLHLSYSGAGPLPEELLRRWEVATDAPVFEGYGLSEAGPVVSFNPLRGARKPASVGVPLPRTEVEIVDLETGTKVLGHGENGEIRVRGPQLMVGYRKRPEETATAMRDGWLYTGDIGEFDADGYLYIRDRKKEMAKVSGYNVFPREIEEVLYRHAAVAEAAVVAVPDGYKGEVVHAFVAPRPGMATNAEHLLEHCGTYLAKYKVPARIVLVESLPKTGVGKIDKNRLRGK